MTRVEWLAQIRPCDKVAIYCGTQLIEVTTVTAAPRTLVTVGKYRNRVSFRRSDGCICGKRPLSHLFRIEQP